MSYDTVKVTVSGMGGTIHNHIAVIKNAFEALGITVTLDDPHPNPKTPEEIISENNMGRLWDKVHIEARHVPWGG